LMGKIQVEGPIFDDVELVLARGGSACGFGCSAGEEIKVDIFGNVFPCPYFTEVPWALGNVKVRRLPQLVADGGFAQTVHTVHMRRYKLAQCAGCVWRDYCGGGCMAESAALRGTIDAEDVWCEARQQFYRDVLIELAAVARRRAAQHALSQ